MKTLATAIVVVGFAAVVYCASISAQEPSATESQTPCEFCNFGKKVLTDAREVVTEPVRWQGRDWGSVAWKSVAVAGSIACHERSHRRPCFQPRKPSGNERTAIAGRAEVS